MVIQNVAFDSQHEDLLHDAQFDYYGKRLATCSSDRTIKLFLVEGEQHTLIDTLRGHEGPVWCVAWAHPKFDSLLASGAYDGRVLIWKENELGKYVQLYEYTQHTGSVNAVAWAPHEYGLCLVVGASDGQCSLLTYVSATQGWQATKWVTHTIGVNTVTWCPNVVDPTTPWMVVSGGCDHRIKCWSIQPSHPPHPNPSSMKTNHETPLDDPSPPPPPPPPFQDPASTTPLHGERGSPVIELMEELKGHEDWVRDVAFAPNLGVPTFYLASCGQDKCVYVWTKSLLPSSKSNGFVKTKVKQFQHVVWRVSWSLSGDRLAVASGDNKVSIWRETVDGEWECVNTLEE
ncbi:GTPase-activating protein S13 [Coelomomyces lativittatus]|nr:GTPase-activating protein S13 [Coelomomyces lativittatus]KAJ1501270.1 GTPase-activating protein S13 [Coelomomyces lativittatus]KAJ1501581.1 GTPase-activating protein S13 [Coelomomyces lativittatus]